MKLKAVLTENTNAELVARLESAEFRKEILEKVLINHLRMRGTLGPAEFYIQKTDFACGSEPMCEVRLTGVSVTTERSTSDFWNARATLEAVYEYHLERFYAERGGFIKKGDRLQLFVSMMTDRPPLDEKTSLLERPPIYIGRDPNATSQRLT